MKFFICNLIFISLFTKFLNAEISGCEKAFFECLSGECIPLHWVCDGEEDCSPLEGEDERNCSSSVPVTTKPTSPAPTISTEQTTSELNYPIESTSSSALDCGGNRFKCVQSNLCIPILWKCDLELDCIYGEDEENCHKRETTIYPETSQSTASTSSSVKCDAEAQFKCTKSNKCIDIIYRCDSFNDCFDAEDEKDCHSATCGSDYYQCEGGRCIPIAWVCDGNLDCSIGRSEEVDCSSAPDDYTTTELHPYSSSTETSVTCKPDFYQCNDDTSLCIHKLWLCDGEPDCFNGSDEENCSNATCEPNSYQCKNGRCIPESWVCDGDVDCGGSLEESEEANCTNHNRICDPSNEFQCKTGKTCIIKTWVCDGEHDCKDSSDEANCTGLNPPGTTAAVDNATTQAATTFQAATDSADSYTSVTSSVFETIESATTDKIDPVLLPETTSTDNPVVDLECTQFKCEKSNQCIPFNWRCDADADCADGEDEEDCHLVSCGSDQFECTSGQCIEQSWVCDGYADCIGDGIDEANCTYKTEGTTTEISNYPSTTKPAETTRQTATTPHPPDDTSPSSPCDKITEFYCVKSHACIPIFWRCDNSIYCHDGEDEENCHLATCALEYYQCESGRCIPKSWICDGQTDCPDDGGDELNCTKSYDTTETDERPTTITTTKQPETTTTYKPLTTPPLIDTTVRHPSTTRRVVKSCHENNFQCHDGECIMGQWRCDGENDCADGSDELSCGIVFPIGEEKEKSRCQKEEFHCKEEDRCIGMSLTCNRVADCRDYSDELDCEFRPCLSNEFKCVKTKHCIYKHWLCDGTNDCIDGTDELDCSNCNSSHFRCPNGQCLSLNSLCDGLFDCLDGSDETNCTGDLKPRIRMVTISEDESSATESVSIKETTPITTPKSPNLICDPELCRGCESHQGEKEKECPSGFDRVSSSCIVAHVYPRSFEKARLYCKNQNAHLLGPISNTFFLVDLIYFLKNEDITEWFYWIGDTGNEGFTIEDKDIRVPHQFSKYGSFNMSDEESPLSGVCYYLDGTKQMIKRAKNCHHSAGFICELNDQKP